MLRLCCAAGTILFLAAHVVLEFSTTVAGGRRVVETVTPMKERDGTWRVSGYSCARSSM